MAATLLINIIKSKNSLHDLRKILGLFYSLPNYRSGSIETELLPVVEIKQNLSTVNVGGYNILSSIENGPFATFHRHSPYKTKQNDMALSMHRVRTYKEGPGRFSRPP